jgi:hypothetical protein
MYTTIPIHWNIKSASASPGRSRVGPALYVLSLLDSTALIAGLYTQPGGGFFFRECLLPTSYCCRYKSGSLPDFTPQRISLEGRKLKIDPKPDLSKNSFVSEISL